MLYYLITLLKKQTTIAYEQFIQMAAFVAQLKSTFEFLDIHTPRIGAISLNLEQLVNIASNLSANK